MPRNVEDIIPQKRSIRDIPIPEGRRRINVIDNPTPTPTPPPPTSSYTPPPRMPVTPQEDYLEPSRKHGKTLWYIIGGVIVILIGAFAILSYFNSATLTYTPRTAQLTFSSTTVTAVAGNASSSDKLMFSIIQLSDDKTTTAPATGSGQVSAKAQGTIIVYNDYSSSPEKLIANTRFATPDGKIYRIQNAITIPGKGSVEATAVADQPGADYNIGLSDFTIPGLQGTPMYSGIYARSKTPMTGGFVGTRGQVSSTDLANAGTALESELQKDILDKASAQVPKDFVLLSNLSEINYGNPAVGSTTDSNATVSEHADFVGVIFKASDLATYLASQKIDKSALTGPINVTDWSTLNASFPGATPSLTSTNSITFTISGTATFKWLTDTQSLSNDLVGKSKSDLPAILKNYPSIQAATAVIKPFWKSTFPTNPGKITIVENATQ